METEKVITEIMRKVSKAWASFKQHRNPQKLTEDFSKLYTEYPKGAAHTFAVAQVYAFGIMATEVIKEQNEQNL